MQLPGQAHQAEQPGLTFDGMQGACYRPQPFGGQLGARQLAANERQPGIERGEEGGQGFGIDAEQGKYQIHPFAGLDLLRLEFARQFDLAALVFDAYQDAVDPALAPAAHKTEGQVAEGAVQLGLDLFERVDVGHPAFHDVGVEEGQDVFAAERRFFFAEQQGQQAIKRLAGDFDRPEEAFHPVGIFRRHLFVAADQQETFLHGAEDLPHLLVAQGGDVGIRQQQIGEVDQAEGVAAAHDQRFVEQGPRSPDGQGHGFLDGQGGVDQEGFFEVFERLEHVADGPRVVNLVAEITAHQAQVLAARKHAAYRAGFGHHHPGQFGITLEKPGQDLAAGGKVERQLVRRQIAERRLGVEAAEEVFHGRGGRSPERAALV